jgi:hypothetical protein
LQGIEWISPLGLAASVEMTKESWSEITREAGIVDLGISIDIDLAGQSTCGG